MRTLIIFMCLFPMNILATSVEWNRFEPEVFHRAKAERKIVLLNLEANWCHWCHVMHDSTYSNPEVIAFLNAHFIAVKADQDAHPELSNRYKEYGWPATIFINADGIDVVKRAGYISPRAFLRLLKAIVADPSPETEEMSLALLKPSQPVSNLENLLEDHFRSSLDYERGGFDQSQKFVEYSTFEYALFGSSDSMVKQWLEASILGARQLSDPAWGGVYQYSTHNDWKHLHFEKLLSIQARYIHLFLWHYLYTGDTTSLRYAKNTVAYADRFLFQPSGLYANAQDADLVQGEHAEEYFALSDAERMKQGVPAIDTNTFTDKNAAMGGALLRLFLVTGNDLYFEKALAIRDALLLRKQPNGCYAHTGQLREVSSLRDQLPMAELLILFLKINPEDRVARKELGELCAAIRDQFGLPNGAFKSFEGNLGITAEPLVEENIQVARTFNWYAHFSMKDEFRTLAQETYRFLASRELVSGYYNLPALLMLTRELNREPYDYVYMNTSSGHHFSDKLIAMLPFYSFVTRGSLDDFSPEKQDLLQGFEVDVLLACTTGYCSAPMYSLEDVRRFLDH